MFSNSSKNQKITQPHAKPELIIPVGHSSIYCVTFSLDGQRALSGSSDGTVKLWDVQTGSELRPFIGHSNTAHSVSFSPDGRHVLSGSWDKTIKLWDIQTGIEIRSFEQHSGGVSSVCFSPDGRCILSGSWDKTIKLWDIQTGIVTRTFEGHKAGVLSVCFSSDARYALSGGEDAAVIIWDIQTGEPLKSFLGHRERVSSVCFSPDGRQALSGGWDGKIKLWDVDSGKEIGSFEGHTMEVLSVCFSPDGRFALSGSDDHSMKLWDIELGQIIRSFDGHTACVNSVSFSPDGYYALSGGWRDPVKLWNIQTGLEIRSFLRHGMSIESVCFTSNGQSALVRTSGSLIIRWDLETGKLVRSFLCPGNVVGRVYFSPDGGKVLVGYSDHSLKLWDIQTGKELKTFEGHTGPLRAACFSPDGKTILSGCPDEKIKLWDIQTGYEIRTFEGHPRYIASVCFTPDGRQILSSGWKTTIKHYEVESGNLIRSIESPIGLDRSFSFSPGGGYALSCNAIADWFILWDISTGNVSRIFDGHTGPVYSVCFSPSGLYALSGSSDSTIKLWDVSTGKEIRTFRGHNGQISSVCFSPDGQYALSGGEDETIKLWNINTGQEIASMIGLDFDDWVITSPSGLFDSSQGALNKIHYAFGLEMISFDQLTGTYHIPGLLPILLSDYKEYLPETPPIEQVRLYPSMEVRLDNNNLIIDLENRGGGIGRVMVYVENIEFIRDARKEPQKDQRRKRLTIQIDLIAYQKFFIPGEPNKLAILCENENGTLRSKPIHIDYSPDSLESKGGRQSETTIHSLKSEAERPLKMHAVFIGSNTQGSSKEKLKYAARDAEKMASVAKAAGKRLYGEKNMVISVFSGESLSKKDIQEEFARMQELTTEDVVMIFLSGHGSTKGEFKEYYYLLKDWGPGVSMEMIIDTPWMREICTLSISELKELVNSIPARKRILILDTCQSGSISRHFSGTKSIDLESYSQIKVIGEVRRSTGFCILSGCAGDKESFEYDAYKHGLMTYSILLGISTGEGLLEKKGKQYIEPVTLFNYVKAKTNDLAKRMNHTQKPEISIPESLAGDLFLGEVTQEEKLSIQLIGVKLFARSRINPINPEDDYGLSKKVDELLVKYAERGELILMEREDNTDVYQILGNYHVDDKDIVIACWLNQGGIFMAGSRKELKCQASEIETAAGEIVRVLHRF